MQRALTISKLLSLYSLIFFIFIGLNYIALERSSLAQVKSSLDNGMNRIKNDLRYVNGKWDTTRYNADPETAYPNASSAHPLTIVTIDGFVIERSKPIAGFLDSADFAKMSGFSQPQTINTLANEQWRVLSKPITRDGKTVGTVVISYYNPDPRILTEVDKKIQDSADHIESQITFHNGKLDISKLDIRNIHYDVAFEIVDSANKVVLNNGRAPSYIDRSYVADALAISGFHTMKDTQTGDSFLVKVEPITDQSGNPLAMIAAGISTDSINDILQKFLISALLIYAILILPLSVLIAYLTRTALGKALHIRSLPQQEIVAPTEVEFDSTQSTLRVHEETIEIPPDSYQYSLCSLLFTAPEKWWTAIELADKLGEKDREAASRKYYDAALAINKKVRFKMIEYKDKSFRLHPAAA